jgi:hypothetical protein
VRGAAIVLVAWGVLNALILVPMPTIFHENVTPALTYAVSAFACVAVGVACWLWPRARGQDPDTERLVTDVSLASALVGIALALMLLGLEFGPWLVLTGSGLLALGIAGVVRELRAERRVRTAEGGQRT